MKRIITVILIFSLIYSLISVPATAISSPTVTVGSVEGNYGDTIEIPIVLSENNGFLNLSVEVGYDSDVLEIVDVVTNTEVGATAVTAQYYDTNPYNISWDNITELNFNGTLATLVFQVISEEKIDSPITVSYYRGRNGQYTDGFDVNYSDDFIPLNLKYVNGSVKLNGGGISYTPKPTSTVAPTDSTQKPALPTQRPIPAGIYVQAGNVISHQNEAVEIPLTIGNNTGFSNLNIEVEYDRTALRLVSVQSNAGIGASTTLAQDISAFPYNLCWDDTNNNTFNGVLATLNFEVLENAVNGNYPINISYYKGRNGDYTDGEDINYDENFEPLNLSYISGSVTIGETVIPTPTVEAMPTVTPIIKPTATPTIQPSTTPDVIIEPQGAYVAMGSVITKKGSIIEIPLTISNNTGFSNLNFEIRYNRSVMNLKSVGGNSEVGANITYAQNVDVFPYNVSWDSPTGNEFNGTLATFTFEILENAESGVYPISLSYYKGRNGDYIDGRSVNYDENFNPLNLSYVNGQVTIQGDGIAENSMSISSYEKQEQITFNINLNSDETITGIVAVAVYDKEWRLISLKTDKADYVVDAIIDNNPNASHIKVIWWSSLSDMRPMAPYTEIKLD